GPVATKVLATGVPATLALPVGPPGPDGGVAGDGARGGGPDPDGLDDGLDDDGSEDGGDEGDGGHFADDQGTWEEAPTAEFDTVVGQPPVDPGSWEPPEPRRRIGSTAAVGAAIVALGTTRPAV